jgi:hypothetical protein
MAIGDDFTINYTRMTVRHTSGSTVYSVNALYSWLMDTFDELGQMDDDVPISAQTPTEYTWTNMWFMDDDSHEYLYGGALKSIGWDQSAAAYPQGIRVVEFESTGYTNANAADLGSAVSGATSDDTGILLHYNNTLRKWWVRSDAAGDTWDPAEVVHVAGSTRGGTAVTGAKTGEALYSNIYTLGSIVPHGSIYVVQDAQKLASWWGTGHIDVLIKVKEAGVEITGAEITVFNRNWTDLYDHFDIDLSPGGRNAVPLATSDDLNNQVSSATAGGYDNITISDNGPYSKDLNNGAGAKNYDISVDCANRPLSEVYEYFKYITRDGSTFSLTGFDGEQYIAAQDSYAPVKASPLGTFAGGIYFGARGIWIENYDTDDSQNFQLIDSSGAQQVPPNTVSIKISSMTAGDQGAMFRLDGAGGDIDKDRYTLSGTHNKGVTGLDVSGSISSDEPAAGYVRVIDAAYEYTQWNGNHFSLSGSTDTTYADGSDLYVPFLDTTCTAGVGGEISNTLIFASNIPVLVRVRKKGIIPFEQEQTITSVGLNVAAIRTEDTIVT